MSYLTVAFSARKALRRESRRGNLPCPESCIGSFDDPVKVELRNASFYVG